MEYSKVKLATAPSLVMLLNMNIATVIRNWPISCDCGIIPQVLSTQSTMIVNNRLRRSHTVANSYGLMPAGGLY